jgi:hypothetical protein
VGKVNKVLTIHLFNLSNKQLTLPLKLKNMKKLLLSNGETVTVTENTRNLGHGEQVEVIYSDSTKGWEHIEDLID